VDQRHLLVIALLMLPSSGYSHRFAAADRWLNPGADHQFVSSTANQDESIALRGFITALIDGRDAALGPLSREERSELHELYEPDYAPLWLHSDGRSTSNLSDALSVLGHALDDGLDPADYYPELAAGVPPRLETATRVPEDVARVDVAVSAGLLRYLRDAHVGRVDPRALGFRLDVPRDQHDFAVLLRVAITSHRVANLVADLRPALAQYRLLRSQLPRYRSLAADPTFVTVQPITRTVHPGELYRDVGVLRDELIAFEDLAADAPPQESGRYEGVIVEGVRHFQVRHGIELDGILGRSTIAALRVPVSWRVRQIELALERLRWVPHVGDRRLIALNIPMFRLWAWDRIPPNGASLFGMDAIVGRALSTQTPVFTAEMGEVIFRPYWYVPRSILRHEVLPKIERDADYLRREDMEIVRGEGDRAQPVEMTPDALVGLRQGMLRVRQRPGPQNALGLIKFAFPNEADVYMHGTPTQALFGKSRRDFSHGCVRVADPVALAEWVLQDLPEWTRDRILTATTGTQTVHVRLPRPIQVILFYTTAAVMPEDGTIRFAEDIYRHDMSLDRAIATRRPVQ
jgi:L,D-transpeptidase YcbB